VAQSFNDAVHKWGMTFFTSTANTSTGGEGRGLGGGGGGWLVVGVRTYTRREVKEGVG